MAGWRVRRWVVRWICACLPAGQHRSRSRYKGLGDANIGWHWSRVARMMPMCIVFGGVRIVHIFLWHDNSDGGEGRGGGEKKPSNNHWGPSPAAAEIHEILLGEGATPAKQFVNCADVSDECVLVTVAPDFFPSGGGCAQKSVGEPGAVCQIQIQSDSPRVR